jgi:hypothetical protein
MFWRWPRFEKGTMMFILGVVGMLYLMNEGQNMIAATKDKIPLEIILTSTLIVETMLFLIGGFMVLEGCSRTFGYTRRLIPRGYTLGRSLYIRWKLRRASPSVRIGIDPVWPRHGTRGPRSLWNENEN